MITTQHNTMLAHRYFVILAAVFQVAISQNPPGPPPPPQCRRPPPLAGNTRPHDCCKFPHIFAEEDLKECGLDVERLADGPPRREILQHCTVQKCLMKKHNLAKEDEETLDEEATKQYLAKWIEKNPDFKDAMETAIEKCIGKELPGPPGVCAVSKTVFCVSMTLISNCPKWEESEQCAAVKNHIEECKKYFE